MIGRRTVKMAELRRIFESMGFSDVVTVLASGNVVFWVQALRRPHSVTFDRAEAGAGARLSGRRHRSEPR